MRVAVFGAGYVGLVTAVGLAEIGHNVVAVDQDIKKVARISTGRIPFYEPGLSELALRNLRDGRLAISSDSSAAIAEMEILFIAVGTPSLEDGRADLRGVYEVASSIANIAQDTKIVVIKSTVPVGTSEMVREILDKGMAERGLESRCHVLSNPEFLKEGSAVRDFMQPDRIILGADSAIALFRIKELYEHFEREGYPLVAMDNRSAELAKYAANAMLATRISFMNELARLADAVGADIELVRRGIGSDSRIGPAFLYAGCGYGGSCFPKDIKALIQVFDQYGLPTRLLRAVDDVNERQKELLFQILDEFFGGDFNGKVIAIWGLAFKPGTDDLRDAVSIPLVKTLSQAGATINVYDPIAMPAAATVLTGTPRLNFAENMYAALEGSDALLLVTEWSDFLTPDFTKISQLMNGNIVVDGRNQWDPDTLNELGFQYQGVGRGRGALSPKGHRGHLR